MDMDGVLVPEEHAIPGADRFLARLRERELPFLVLTNNSIYTRRDLAARLRTSGLDVPEESIWTSALATAQFLADQRPGGSAFVIGEAGLTTALHEAGYTQTERDPDYVILGETRTYSFERITHAIRLVAAGARFIATNPDPTGPSAQGPLPATGSVAALISRATGVDPYFVGKPNPLMMRSALNAIDAHSETTAMIGDRMDTDVVAGLEAGLETVLVLTGVDHEGRGRALPLPAGAHRRVGGGARGLDRLASRSSDGSSSFARTEVGLAVVTQDADRSRALVLAALGLRRLRRRPRRRRSRTRPPAPLSGAARDLQLHLDRPITSLAWDLDGDGACDDAIGPDDGRRARRLARRHQVGAAAADRHDRGEACRRAPDVPTLAEKGIAGFPAEPWTAFFAPAGTPEPILARLSGGLVEALNDAGVREKLKPVMEVETSTPEALRAMVERDIERYGNLVRHVGMKVE